MSPGGKTAADVLNTTAAELASILRRYGEERFATRIADRIVAARADTPLDSSARLVELIDGAIPMAARRRGGHPAKRTFQALRIEVNSSSRPSNRRCRARSQPVARWPDRRIGLSLFGGPAGQTSAQRRRQRSSTARPAGRSRQAPAAAAAADRGAARPTAAEVAVNPRSASARLRAAVRIAEPERRGCRMSALWAPLGSSAADVEAAGGRWLKVVPRVPRRLARLSLRSGVDRHLRTRHGGAADAQHHTRTRRSNSVPSTGRPRRSPTIRRPFRCRSIN